MVERRRGIVAIGVSDPIVEFCVAQQLIAGKPAQSLNRDHIGSERFKPLHDKLKMLKRKSFGGQLRQMRRAQHQHTGWLPGELCVWAGKVKVRLRGERAGQAQTCSDKAKPSKLCHDLSPAMVCYLTIAALQVGENAQ